MPTTTFETISAAAAGKVKTCHYPLQVSSIAVHVHPAHRSMQVNYRVYLCFCQSNFEDENFMDDQFIANNENYIPQKFVHSCMVVVYCSVFSNAFTNKNIYYMSFNKLIYRIS